MGFLTAGTYWLLQNTLLRSPQAISANKAHAPDYFAKQFSISILDESGITQYRISATSAVHYENDAETHATLLSIRAFSPGQPVVTTTGKYALINADSLILDLYNDACIMREASQTDPPIQANSQHFRVLMHDNIIKTDKLVKLQRGPLKMRAYGMIYDNVSQKIRLLNKVHGMISASNLSATKPLQLVSGVFFSRDMHESDF